MVNIKFSALTDGSPLDLTDRYVGLPSAGAAQIFDVRCIHVVKSADETIDTSTVLQDDNELLFTPTINKTYLLMFFLLVNSPSAADIQYRITAPTAATARRISGDWQSITSINGANFLNSSGTSPTNGSDQFTCVVARLVMGANAGNVVLQWAQDTSNVGDTSVLQGSTLIAWEQ